MRLLTDSYEILSSSDNQFGGRISAISNGNAARSGAHLSGWTMFANSATYREDEAYFARLQIKMRLLMKSFGPMLLASAALAFTLSPGFALTAQQPDNTAQNKSQSPTADNQSNAQGDRTLAQQVRKAIIGDKDLSTYAHNVKVIAMNGQVTLKGPVKSDDEKQKVAADAASVAGADKVSNELTVKQ